MKFLKSDWNAVIGGAEHKEHFLAVLYSILRISGTAKIQLLRNHTKTPQECCRSHLEGPSFVLGTMVKNYQKGRNILLKQLCDHLLIIILSEATSVADCEVATLENGFSLNKQYWQEETLSRTGAGAKDKEERNGLMHHTVRANTADV